MSTNYNYMSGTATEQQQREFSAHMKVVRNVESLGKGLQALGLKCRWSTHDPKSDIYIDPATMQDKVRGSANVKMLFDCENLEHFNTELKYLQALKTQHETIQKLRAESVEFDAMWKEVEFTLLLGS